MASRSPSSSAGGHPGSDAEAPSSPPRDEGKSFMLQAIADDDTQMDDTQMDDTQMDDTRMDDTRMDDTRMDDMTPEPTEKPTRGKGKQNKESNHPIGKIRHLKKEDGEPLWRKDIQYDFLKAIFDDETAVFTNSYVDADNGGPKIGPQNFADLYIDTMSRSSKTSRVLREKLLSDRDAAKGMAMVCLLVNIGRMNTTLNCKLALPSQWPLKTTLADLTNYSLPRDASPAANLPCYPVTASTPRPPCIQATSGCASPEIHPEGWRRRSQGA